MPSQGRHFTSVFAVTVAATMLALFAAAPAAKAHCDTLSGPVVADARKALDAGEATPVLKWVQEDGEAEIRAAFERTLAVRKLSPEAKDLADMYFFETLVRIHRAGEGAPYTGLKPAGEVDPVIAAADKALDTGSVDALATEVSERAAQGIRERFAEAAEKRKHADESVEAGREYVRAYVTFTHYVENLDKTASGPAGEHGEERPAGGHAHAE